jgi:hypothetical protein
MPYAIIGRIGPLALRSPKLSPRLTACSSGEPALAALGIRRLVVSDSVAIGEHPPPGCEVRTLAPLLAEAMSRLEREESLADLIVHQ